jgi:hypothetical protein
LNPPVDNLTEPASDREAMQFTEVYLGKVDEADFRKNARSDLGTRTATLDKFGIAKLRSNWIYRIVDAKPRTRAPAKVKSTIR